MDITFDPPARPPWGGMHAVPARGTLLLNPYNCVLGHEEIAA
jgi:hypothetical protein